MTKRIEAQLNKFINRGEAARFTLGTLVLMACGVMLIIIATFTQLSFTHPIIPLDIFSHFDKYFTESGINWAGFLKHYKYIPQIPVVLFIVALMGRKFGILAILMYIFLGLIFPIFALGGGISYFFEYGFGYILAFIPAIFFAGTLLKGKTDILRVFLISLIGVLIIHVLGILYMFFIATLRHAPMDLVTSWIISQSGVQVFYDIFFAMIAIFAGRQMRKLLWIVMC